MKTKSRKQARKEFRKAKKIKKHEFFSKKKPKTKQGGQKFQKKTASQFENKQKSFMKTNENEKKEKKIVKRTDIEKLSQKIEKSVSKDKVKNVFKNPQEQMDFERAKERKQKQKLEKEIREQRVKQLKRDNLKEDLEIRKLEKQMKMKKGKSKAFAVDGLDYLLDICDKSESGNAFEKALEESDSDFESDLENIVEGHKNKHSKEKKEIKKIGKKKKEPLKEEEFDSEMENEDDVDGEDESMEDEEEEEDMESGDENMEDEEEEDVESGDENMEDEEEDMEDDLNSEFNSESDEESNKPKVSIKRKKEQQDKKTSTKKVTFSENIDGDVKEGGISSGDEEMNRGEPKVWEDIYGRTRDEKGNVVNTYTPPHLRKKAEGETLNEKIVRLKKQLKGLLNRLAESNMAFISNQIEQLYMSNSRNDMNETLCNLFSDSLVSESLTPERLITEHAMLIAVLHANIGSEIGAHFLQYSVIEFCKMLESDPDVEDKRINNVLLFILHLYNFQVFHSKLMYDIINKLLENLEEKQIELLLTALRTIGFNLRKDDPIALKNLVLKVQEQANSITTGENSSRVKFMLEMLMAIKNNNMSKIPNYNPEFVEKLRKNLKILVRKGNYSTELNISLQDLLNAEKHGRWWIVGSAWSGSAPSLPDANKPKSEEVPSTEFSQKLLELARKQRMNTDVRRNIFCILMSAEDFLEAFEKLLKLKLKGAVEREIMNVLLHCALQEKNFNPYYMFLANKFCTFDRKYQMMLQCAIWDKIKELKNALPIQVTNLAKFVGNVILERGLPISILKVIQFSELDKPTMKFMRQVLLTIFLNEDRNAVAAVFHRIADSSKLKLFRESLRLFLQHFVLKKTAKNVEEERVSHLAEMVKVAEQALTSSDVSMVF